MVDDFFRNRLDQMIDLRHPLAVLANRMPWQEIEASLAQRWARQVKAAKKIEGLDLFGPVSVVAGGGTSNAGRPRLPTRLMVALLYLKHAFNESDEEVIERRGETPTWQYFSGNEYFEHQWPCDPTQVGRFRKALGEEGVEELLARTMEVAITLKLIARKELARVIVDSTVQEKAVAHPTDSKLLEAARAKVVEAAKANGIELKQTYAKEGQHLSFKAGRYAHARQFRRMRKAIKRQRTIVGRLQREVGRKMSTLSQAVQEALSVTRDKAKRLVVQTSSRKALGNRAKLDSWHAPEVECIGKDRPLPSAYRYKNLKNIPHSVRLSDKPQKTGCMTTMHLGAREPIRAPRTSPSGNPAPCWCAGYKTTGGHCPMCLQGFTFRRILRASTTIPWSAAAEP